MSEYQYYEFQAIDEPLSSEAQRYLRSLTSRAEITATSLVNVYHWGSFKGNPLELMKEYFDAFLHTTNWGAHTLMLRLPRKFLPPEQVQPYARGDTLTVATTATHTILTFDSTGEPAYDYESDEGSGLLASLLPLRQELLSGDLRSLYLGWLANLVEQLIADEDLEPLIPPGLRNLTGAQQRLADFLYIPDDLIDIAARASADREVSTSDTRQLKTWVQELSVEEKDRILLRLLSEPTAYLQTELLQRFRKETAGGEDLETTPGRSAQELWTEFEQLAEEQKRQRQEESERQRQRLEQEQRAARERHLDSLASKVGQIWSQIETAVATKQARQYDEAVNKLRDLAEIAERKGKQPAFLQRLAQLRALHARKGSFIQKLDKAGLTA